MLTGESSLLKRSVTYIHTNCGTIPVTTLLVSYRHLTVVPHNLRAMNTIHQSE